MEAFRTLPAPPQRRGRARLVLRFGEQAEAHLYISLGEEKRCECHEEVWDSARLALLGVLRAGRVRLEMALTRPGGR